MRHPGKVDHHQAFGLRAGGAASAQQDAGPGDGGKPQRRDHRARAPELAKLMSKSELIQKIAAEHSNNMTRKDVKAVIDLTRYDKLHRCIASTADHRDPVIWRGGPHSVLLMDFAR